MAQNDPLDESDTDGSFDAYAEGLYGYEKICCYGIAFFQKQAKVKLLSGK